MASDGFRWLPMATGWPPDGFWSVSKSQWMVLASADELVACGVGISYITFVLPNWGLHFG